MQSQLQLFDNQLHFMNLLYPNMFEPTPDQVADLQDFVDSDNFKGDNHSQDLTNGSTT